MPLKMSQRQDHNLNASTYTRVKTRCQELTIAHISGISYPFDPIGVQLTWTSSIGGNIGLVKYYETYP